MRVAVLTCKQLPEPDVDEPLVLDALRARGAEAEMVPWDEPADLARFDLAIIRSTWNYYREPDAFVAFLARAAAETRLENPVEVAIWNHHKRYLLELEAEGLSIVPTALAPRGEGALDDAIAGRGWSRVVIKPAVSAGSFLTRRFDEVDDEARAFFASLVAERDVIVQPYLPTFETDGERAIVAIDGELSHAILKRPRFAGQAESVERVEIRPEDRAVAEAALARFPGLLYGRVDLIRDEGGATLISELELLEPSLFFRQHPPALERFADACLRRGR